MRKIKTVFLVLATIMLLPSAAIADGPFVGDSLVCRSGATGVAIDSYPSDAKTVVIERRVTDTYWWKARRSLPTLDSAYGESLPAHSYAADYRVHAKDSKNRTIETTTCELSSYHHAGIVCTARKNNDGSYKLSLSQLGNSQLIVTRQTTATGRWHWRTKATSTELNDSKSPTGNARYRIVVKSADDSAQVEAIVACQDLSASGCQYVQLTDGMPEGWQQRLDSQFGSDGRTLIPVVPVDDFQGLIRWAEWSPGGGPAKLLPDGQRPSADTPELPDGSAVEVSYQPSWRLPLVVKVKDQQSGRLVWAPDDLRQDALGIEQIALNPTSTEVMYSVSKRADFRDFSEVWSYDYESRKFALTASTRGQFRTMTPIGFRAFEDTRTNRYPEEIEVLRYLNVASGDIELATAIQQSIEAATGMRYRTSIGVYGSRLFVTVASASELKPAGVAYYDLDTRETSMLYTVPGEVLVSTPDRPLTAEGTEKSSRYEFLINTDYGGDRFYNRPVILDMKTATVTKLSKLVTPHDLGGDSVLVGSYLYNSQGETIPEAIVVDPGSGTFALVGGVSVVGIDGTITTLSRHRPSPTRLRPGCP